MYMHMYMRERERERESSSDNHHYRKESIHVHRRDTQAGGREEKGLGGKKKGKQRLKLHITHSSSPCRAAPVYTATWRGLDEVSLTN